MSPITVSVDGLGTDVSPWKITLSCNSPANCEDETNPEDKFFRITSSDETIGKAKVARSTVTRIEASLAASLIAGKPDLDAMFDNPVNQTQQFTKSITGCSTFPTVTIPRPAQSTATHLPPLRHENAINATHITAQVSGEVPNGISGSSKFRQPLSTTKARIICGGNR